MPGSEPPSPTAPPRVFLCYARGDNEAVAKGSGWRDRLVVHLRPFEKDGRLTIFFDECTETGDEWHERIQQEVGACDIAVLMISAAFLDSDYIREKEVPALLRRHDEKSVRLIPLLLRQCAWQRVVFRYTDPSGRSRERMLSELQGVLPANKPLNSLDEGAQDEALTKVATEILEQASNITKRRAQMAVPSAREDGPTKSAPPLRDSAPAQEPTDPVVEPAHGAVDRPRSEPSEGFPPAVPDSVGVHGRDWAARHGRLLGASGGLLVVALLIVAIWMGAFQRGRPNGSLRFTNSLGMVFVPIPGIDAWFSIWETRVQDFEVFVRETGYDATSGMFSLRADGWKQHGDTWKNPGFSQTGRHPICGVNWEDAQAFCRWLSQKENRTYRLPTDLEWSGAVGLSAETGATRTDRDEKVVGVYPWGNTFPPPSDAGNYGGSEARDANWPADFVTIEGFRDGYARTAPVGSFKTNRFGLHDLGGNVWEWCEDKSQPDQDWRVLRGGSWCNYDPRYLLSSDRKDVRPDSRNASGGFRVVMMVESRKGGHRTKA
jgi:formylglycine-generating enzyme required for sulfatase activity